MLGMPEHTGYRAEYLFSHAANPRGKCSTSVAWAGRLVVLVVASGTKPAGARCHALSGHRANDFGGRCGRRYEETAAHLVATTTFDVTRLKNRVGLAAAGSDGLWPRRSRVGAGSSQAFGDLADKEGLYVN